MTPIPIVKMTLYKHGVGFYTRQGPVSGEAAGLVFRKEEMNDVLKSLTAVAPRGGRVLGMDYDTPENKAERLGRSSIRLSDEASLRDLLRDLRGRAVRVETTAGDLAGLMVGVDLPGEREPVANTVLSLLGDGEQVRPLRLGDVMALTLADERAASDLRYFLETSLTEEEKRTVTVRVAAGTPELSVSYIAPSPVWRVSYRLVADAEGETPAALLQGWGLFDNTLDEDLENVELTFVSGMPVSFIYDLYTPFTPERPVVQEESRAVAKPVEFEEAMYRAAPIAAPAAAAAPPSFGGGVLREAAAAPRRMARAMDLAESTAVSASGKMQGEYFSYAVGEPVTVRRGRSAMAPILQANAGEAAWGLRKERIYNGRKQPKHPVVTMRLRNASGLTLERGPLTVIEGGEYAGEAMLPFTAAEGEVFLAYAVDLGIGVTEEAAAGQEMHAVHIRDGMLLVEEYHIQRVTYRVSNRGSKATGVIVEHPRANNYTTFDTPDPVETTSDTVRYAVEVGPRATAELTVSQRRLVARREELRNQKLDQLRRWLRDRLLDEATYAKLQGILALYDRIGEHEAALKRNEAERHEILGQQQTIQGNLGALKESGEEGQLRARYARTLQEQEDRLTELKKDDARTRKAIQDTQQEIVELVKGLGGTQ